MFVLKKALIEMLLNIKEYVEKILQGSGKMI